MYSHFLVFYGTIYVEGITSFFNSLVLVVLRIVERKKHICLYLLPVHASSRCPWSGLAQWRSQGEAQGPRAPNRMSGGLRPAWHWYTIQETQNATQHNQINRAVRSSCRSTCTFRGGGAFCFHRGPRPPPFTFFCNIKKTFYLIWTFQEIRNFWTPIYTAGGNPPDAVYDGEMAVAGESWPSPHGSRRFGHPRRHKVVGG